MLTNTRTTDVLTYRRCRRAWYYGAVAHVPVKPKGHLDRGTLGHADVERWLTTGQLPRTPAGARLCQNLADRGLYPGMAADASSGVGLFVEWAWQMPVYPDGPDFGAVTYTGQADLIILQPGQPPILIDHKTMAMLDAGDTPWTANVRGALSSDELRVNTQLRVYGHAIFELLAPHAGELVVMHNAAETRGKAPLGRLTGATITRDEAKDTFDAVVSTVAAMRKDALAASAEGVPGDPTGAACSAFGGCPFKSRCSTWARLQSRTPAVPAAQGDTLMSMLDDIAGAPEAPTAQATNKAAPAATPPTAPAVERVQRTGPAEGIDPDTGLRRLPLDLFIDCVPVPVHGQVLELQHLEQYVGPLVDVVCQKAGVPHYGFIDGWQGKAQVAALLEANLPEGILLVDSRLPLSPACIEVLVRHASTICRGTR